MDVLEQVLSRLGLAERPAPTLDGLQRLYAAWCRKVPFDNVFAILDGVDDLRELLLGQIFGADARLDVGLGEDDLRVAGANAVNIPERDINALVRGNFYSNDAGHVLV